MDPLDRTVLLGENTGYMDMTGSQTIDFKLKDEFNPEFTFNMCTASESHRLNKGMPCKTLGTIEKGVMHSIFSDLLASLPEKTAQDVPVSFPKKMNDNFILENASIGKLDMEDVLPICLTKPALPERDHTNMSILSDVDQKTCQFVCDDNSEMIMTEILDKCVQEREQLSEQNRVDHFQSTVPFAPMIHSDDIEVTPSKAVVFDVEPFPSKTDEIMMNTTKTGHKTSDALAVSKISECSTLATHTVFYNDQNDFMELTCQALTGVLSPNLDNSVLTRYSNLAKDSRPISTTKVIISKPQASFILPSSVCPDAKPRSEKSELSLPYMEEDMEMTQCHTAGNDLEKTCHTVTDDMETTQCQTLVPTYKSCNEGTPSDKSKKRLSLGSKSFRNEGMIYEDTEHMKLNSYSFSKRTKTENCVVPTAQWFHPQDLSDCIEIQQGTASYMPVVHDDMELTECKPIIADSASDQTFGIRTDDIICKSSSSNNVNEHVSHNSTVKYAESPEENCNMEITGAFTLPLVDNCCVAFNQEEMARGIVKIAPVTTQIDNNKTVSSAKTENCSFGSDIDTLKQEYSSSVKSRRKSLADLQVQLQNISQYISEPDRVLAESVTAPLVGFTVVSPVKKHSKRSNTLQPSKETQLLENKINLSPKESTAPFSLKNSLMSRLSVGGIIPKFPPRARSASPNQTEPKSSNGLQGLQPQTCFNANVQNDSYETDLIDEVLPEEDLSGTLVTYLSSNKEQEVTWVDLNEDAIKYNHTEPVMNTSYSEKMQPEVKNTTIKDSSKKMVRFVLF